MSGTFPSTPKPASCSLRSFSPTFVSVSHSLRRQARSRGGQRFAISLTWPPMLRAKFAPIFAFAIKQRGQYETFQIVLPAPYSSPQGSWAGSALVDGAAQVGRAVNLKGYTPSAAGVIKAGDLFKFNGHTKVYVATADANADGAGKVAGLAIEPALVTSPADGESVQSSGSRLPSRSPATSPSIRSCLAESLASRPSSSRSTDDEPRRLRSGTSAMGEQQERRRASDLDAVRRRRRRRAAHDGLLSKHRLERRYLFRARPFPQLSPG
jgi:hypothetical protein